MPSIEDGSVHINGQCYYSSHCAGELVCDFNDKKCRKPFKNRTKQSTQFYRNICKARGLPTTYEVPKGREGQPKNRHSLQHCIRQKKRPKKSAAAEEIRDDVEDEVENEGEDEVVENEVENEGEDEGEDEVENEAQDNEQEEDVDEDEAEEDRAEETEAHADVAAQYEAEDPYADLPPLIADEEEQVDVPNGRNTATLRTNLSTSSNRSSSRSQKNSKQAKVADPRILQAYLQQGMNPKLAEINASRGHVHSPEASATSAPLKRTGTRNIRMPARKTTERKDVKKRTPKETTAPARSKKKATATTRSPPQRTPTRTPPQRPHTELPSNPVEVMISIASPPDDDSLSIAGLKDHVWVTLVTKRYVEEVQRKKRVTKHDGYEGYPIISIYEPREITSRLVQGTNVTGIVADTPLFVGKITFKDGKLPNNVIEIVKQKMSS
jgi:hypothetical protein